MTATKARTCYNAGISSAALIALTAMSGTGHAQTTFDGQTIRVVIASTASGPTDVVGRQFAPFISKHTPGKPTIVVENRPGAAGAVAANYFYNVAKPDGLTIGLTFGMVTQGLMQNAGIKFDPAQFNILGAVSATQVLLARKDLGLKAPRDLLKPATPLVLAGLGSGSTADAGNRLFLDLIGATYKYVGGYPGQAEAILSVARGETNLANATHSAYLARRDAIRKEGLYDAFLQRGELTAAGTFKRNVQLPEMPTTIEAIEQIAPAASKSGDFAAYRSIIGALAVHYSFVLPPKTAPAIVETLRKTLSAAADDPEARRVIKASLRSDYEFLDGPASQKIVERLRQEYAADPRIGQRLKQIMSVK
jgi:tripartite-type tricarboxylate transporter receptor subunit TctC